VPQVAGLSARVAVRANATVPFHQEPCVACARPGWWRIRDPRRMLWAPDVRVEALSDDRWADVRGDVEPLGGFVYAGAAEKVRVSGRFFPYSSLGDAERWLLETEVRTAAAATLGAGYARPVQLIAGATVQLDGCQFDTESAAAGGPIVVEMKVGETAAHTGVGRPRADRPGVLTVTFAADELALAAA